MVEGVNWDQAALYLALTLARERVEELELQEVIPFRRKLEADIRAGLFGLRLLRKEEWQLTLVNLAKMDTPEAQNTLKRSLQKMRTIPCSGCTVCIITREEKVSEWRGCNTEQKMGRYSRMKVFPHFSSTTP